MSERSREPLRVAICGGGPKGTYALERLAARFETGQRPAMTVTIFEPHPYPGAGPNYAPDLPSYLRMNFSASQVNMWPADSTIGTAFSSWRVEHGLGNEAYPPRADVGRYLADGFESLRARTGAAVLAKAVDDISSHGSGWQVVADGDAAHYDEVLVATGHAWAPAEAASWDTAVFPVERELSQDRIPPGGRVAIRGFALTMIDAALALTEGRGGRFEPSGSSHQLTYVPGGDEPGAMVPWSRTGRPMLAKPEPTAIQSPALDEIAARGRAQLMGSNAGRPLDVLMDGVANVASASLRELGGRRSADSLRTGLEAASHGSSLIETAQPLDAIERSVAIAAGAERPDATWSLGHAWRAVYPALVERLGGGALAARDWPAFRLLAGEMERIAFGPPPVNAAKLAALIRAGVVDLTQLRGEPAAGADVTIDAVLSASGARDLPNTLPGKLVAAGLARTAPGRRGLEVTEDVTCVSASGEPSHGLGALGRPTEDWIIGNDTLNRDLHAQPELWARRVVERARVAS